MRYYLNPKVNHSQLGYEGMEGDQKRVSESNRGVSRERSPRL